MFIAADFSHLDIDYFAWLAPAVSTARRSAGPNSLGSKAPKLTKHFNKRWFAPCEQRLEKTERNNSQRYSQHTHREKRSQQAEQDFQGKAKYRIKDSGQVQILQSSKHEGVRAVCKPN